MPKKKNAPSAFRRDVLHPSVSVAMRPLFSQVLYGSLTGTVQDASGVIVPGATDTIRNVGTGQVLTTAANSDGIYLRPDMQEGRYDLTVTLNGFKSFTLKGIGVTVNAITREDITLQIGQISEKIAVSASALELQTDKTDLHTDLTAAEVNSLPLGHYRNF